MFWLRLLVLGLACVAAGCCSTSGSCYEPNQGASHADECGPQIR